MDSEKTAAGIRRYFDQVAAILGAVDTRPLADVVAAIHAAQANGKKVFTMGNGGHGNTAAHMINDLAKHTVSSDAKDEVVTGKRFKTMCLNDSVSFLTGLANDMGYEHVFSEQLRNWCEEGDVVIGVSGSGNSANVLKAFEVAKARGATTICLSGKGGGRAKEVADICVVVPCDKMVQIEDVHLAINHAIADELKKIVQERDNLTG
ncbi:MAG TPA: SIS domain-containing protein [Candidatus Hydrogenedentes bacterium]|nr:SIS domain-containing protein [Candidatus Hydrogenedentota bacterium]